MVRGVRGIWGGREHAIVELEPAEERSVLSSLTPHEQQVALLAIEGLSNREIAARRRTAERTVANQIASIYRKLHIRSRTELVLAIAGSRSND